MVQFHKKDLDLDLLGLSDWFWTLKLVDRRKLPRSLLRGDDPLTTPVVDGGGHWSSVLVEDEDDVCLASWWASPKRHRM